MASFGELLGAEILDARERKGWTQLALSEIAYGDHQAERRIRDYENGKVKRPQSKVYLQICDAVGITRRRISELKSISGDTRAINRAEIDDLRAEKGSLEQAFSDLKSLSRGQLETLATVFEIENVFDFTNEALLNLLTRKAEDYQALRNEVKLIDDGLKRLSNLKLAATAAIESGYLDEVEFLLSQVQEVELEEASKTAELRASNELLRGRAESAFRILESAAESFGAIDEIEPVRKRLLFNDILYRHGKRYGGSAVRLAADIISGDRVDAVRLLDIELWASVQNNLSNALKVQGTRSVGDEGMRLLGEATSACRAALGATHRDAHPLRWATMQNNLGNSLLLRGLRIDTTEGTKLLGEAILTYRKALEVISRSSHPLDWARTQNNLAVTLKERGKRTSGKEGMRLLKKASAAFKAVLQVRTIDTHPLDWATSMSNLAIAFKEQAVRTNGKDGMELMKKASAAYHAVLQVRTRDQHPASWAEAKANLAMLEESRSEHEDCTDPRPHLKEALVHLSDALEVFNEKQMFYHLQNESERKEHIEAKLKAL